MTLCWPRLTCIVALQSIVSRNVDPLQCGCGHLHGGRGRFAQNQIPERSVMTGHDAHACGREARGVEQGIRRVADGIAADFGMRAEVEFRPGVTVTANHAAEARPCCASRGKCRTTGAARSAAGDDWRRFRLVSAGEARRFRLDRQRRQPAPQNAELHNPGYDFNDAILPAAAAFRRGGEASTWGFRRSSVIVLFV